MRVLLCVLLTAGNTFAQYLQEIPPETIARERRATRDKAVAHAGPAARALVESEYGDEAAAALLKCSPECAAKFAESGIAKLSQPQRLLRLISRQENGNDVAMWIISHPTELADDIAADLFIEEPYRFVLSLKRLSVAAEERRAERLEAEKLKKPEVESKPEEVRSPFISDLDRRRIGAIAAVGVVGFVVWRRKRRMDLPA